MARRVSALPDFGTVPIFSPVAGLIDVDRRAGIGLHPFAVDEVGLRAWKWLVFWSIVSSPFGARRRRWL